MGRLSEAQKATLQDIKRIHPMGPPLWYLIHPKMRTRLSELGLIEDHRGFAVLTDLGRSALAQSEDARKKVK